MLERILPVGKLPADLLARLLAQAPVTDSRVLLGPGVGLDCAVIDLGSTLLVLKSDPITFATDEIGWYSVQVNANDIATTGAIPRWFLMSVLLPEQGTTPSLAEEIAGQVYRACAAIGVSVVGGHSEITFGLDRPVLMGTMIGETTQADLVTPRGLQPGDRLLLTKGVPVEATALLARQLPEKLDGILSPTELREAQNYLFSPGISVLRDAQLATKSGRVTAMHDPTEGGLATALWELAEGGEVTLYLDPASVPIPPLAARVCQAFALNPLASIASGALLLTAPTGDSIRIRQALEADGILCAEIGIVEEGPVAVWQKTANGRELLPRPERDEIARLFEQE